MEQLPFDFSTADAMALGARAFGFLSGDPVVVVRLLAGEPRDRIPALLQEPSFLVRVFDELIASENALAWFAGTVGVPVTAPYEARRLLGAGSTDTSDRSRNNAGGAKE